MIVGMEGLKLILDKLSQYNFMTNMLPGAVLCIALKYVVGYDLFVSTNWLMVGIIFYFVGMINNRFGSLFVEWFLKTCHIVQFAPYGDFVKAEKEDGKITTLNMENNVFRSYISVCLLAILAWVYKFLCSKWTWLDEQTEWILLVLLLVLFVLSYRKQTKYVRARVEANLRN